MVKTNILSGEMKLVGSRYELHCELNRQFCGRIVVYCTERRNDKPFFKASDGFEFKRGDLEALGEMMDRGDEAFRQMLEEEKREQNSHEKNPIQ